MESYVSTSISSSTEKTNFRITEKLLKIHGHYYDLNIE